MAKPHKWTVETAKKYIDRNANNMGLTYWAAHDYLVRVGVIKA